MGDVNLEIKLNNLKENVSDINKRVDEYSRVIADNGDYLKSKNNIVYPYTNATKTTNGITFTDNKDGSITINGTTTATAWYSFSGKESSVAVSETYTSMRGTYTLSGGAENVNLFIRFDTESANGPQFNADNGVSTTFTVPESSWDRVALQMYITSGKTFNNVTVRPMLEKGSIATDFVPYVKSNVELASDLAMLIETLKSKGVID